MKAAPFAYVRPLTVSDAVAELAETDGAGKVLAGGQSLAPVLAMRLARPDTLIDINAVAGLDRIVRSDQYLDIGATVRQRALERDPDAAAVPLLRMTIPWVGHRELRSRGTVCGSLAHADPAAELPAVACCLDGELTVTSVDGERSVRAREFFTGAMTTDLGDREIVSAVRLPCAQSGEGFGFAEIARRHGDFALAGLVARVRITEDRLGAVLTGFGISDRPVTRTVTSELEAAVHMADREGTSLDMALEEVLAPVTHDMVDTAGDAHASCSYRRRLLHAFARRELGNAHRRATSATEVTSDKR